jgi:hypothetical protein
MGKNKLIIGGMITVAVIVVIAVFVFIRQREPNQQEPPIPVEQQEPLVPVEQQELFVPDMTIGAEFCRDVITKAQLREITGYQGEFIFIGEEQDDRIFGPTGTCIISSETKGKIAIIGVTDLDFETAINRIKLEEPRMYAMMRELDNVGEKAVIAEEWGIYIIFFSDGDINRLVAVDSMGALTREETINLARQVEANIR